MDETDKNSSSKPATTPVKSDPSKQSDSNTDKPSSGSLDNTKALQEEANNGKSTEDLKADDNTSKKPPEVLSTNNSSNNQTEEKSDQNMDDDGEDLPDNFFDDFSNKDFMAGLDIVDDWNDDGDGEKSQDDYFVDDVQVRNIDKEKKDSKHHGKSEGKREHSPPRHYRDKPRYEPRDHHNRRRYSRDRHSREDDRSLRHRDRSRERWRSRERDRERERDRSRDRRSRDREHNRSRGRENRSRPRQAAPGTSAPEKHSDKSPAKGSGTLPKHSRSTDNPDKAAEEVTDSRRDPEKTKRDIQRDKLRCAKDFEARVFQEQLKVAETGLVPPGTELDVVLETEKQKQIENDKKVEEVKQVEKKEESDHHAADWKRTERPKHNKSRSRIRGRYSRNREMEARKDAEYRRRRRPPRHERERDRSMSPIRHRRRSRSLDREEMYRRNDDLRLRIREKRRERYINELSPVSEARMTRSPSLTNLSLISNISDREQWLRNKDRYKSRYGRSCSPISSSSLSDTGSPKRKRSRKTSFMEEIQRKLRDKSDRYASKRVNDSSNKRPLIPDLFATRVTMPLTPPLQPVFQPNPMPMPMPMPFYPPQPQPQMMMNQPGMVMHREITVVQPTLDFAAPQNVMGGQPGMMGGPQVLATQQTVVGSPPIVLNIPQHLLPNTPDVMQHAAIANPVQQPPVMQTPASVLLDSLRTHNNLNANKEVTKLFEEQKISLSDYLSVSAKPIDPKSPINVHKKIKVIAKCQEVIRVLNDDSKFIGRFFPKPSSPNPEKLHDSSMKWKSPLRKIFPVRFMFTTPCKKPPEDSVRVALNKVLMSCGLLLMPEKNNSASASAAQKIPTTVSAPKSTPPPPAPKPLPAPISFSIATQKPKNPPIIKQAQFSPVKIETSTTSVQTDPVKCQICEIRSARKFCDSGTQTYEKDTVDESTQVSVEDLNKSCVTFTPRGILKNSAASVQSISHMTPAQLLALQKEDETMTNTWSNTNLNSLRNDSFSMSRNQMDRFSLSTSSMNMNSSSYNEPNFLNRNMNNPLASNKSPSFVNDLGNSFKSNFSGNMDNSQFNKMLPDRSFGGRPASMMPGSLHSDFQSMQGMHGRGGSDSHGGGMGSRPADRFSGGGNFSASDRYSPEQNFNDSSSSNMNTNYMNRNAASNVRGRGAPNRGFLDSGNYNPQQNRQFFG